MIDEEKAEDGYDLYLAIIDAGNATTNIPNVKSLPPVTKPADASNLAYTLKDSAQKVFIIGSAGGGEILAGLYKNAKNITDFRTFEIKSIDLADNAHSSGALSMEEKLKNIQKLCIWASYGFSLQTNWQPTNNFIQEVFEVALECSKNLVVKDLLEPISKPDFFASALYKIEELRPVFYIE